MKKYLITICFAISCIIPAISQELVKFRINASYGFSNPKGEKDIVVDMPGKTAHEIYTMMATNIGVIYYEPNNVMYGVQDAFISVCGSSSDFCRNGDQKWSAKYILKFIIKDGKVLILNPTIRNLKEENTSLYRGKELSFVDFVNQYWYNRGEGHFISSESVNMDLCESYMSTIANQILGLEEIYLIPKNW